MPILSYLRYYHDYSLIFRYAASAQPTSAVTNNHYIKILQNTHRLYTEYIRCRPHYLLHLYHVALHLLQQVLCNAENISFDGGQCCKATERVSMILKVCTLYKILKIYMWIYVHICTHIHT